MPCFSPTPVRRRSAIAAPDAPPISPAEWKAETTTYRWRRSYEAPLSRSAVKPSSANTTATSMTVGYFTLDTLAQQLGGTLDRPPPELTTPTSPTSRPIPGNCVRPGRTDHTLFIALSECARWP